jgi:hypothetical protein
MVGRQVGRGPGSDAKWLAPPRDKARRDVGRKGRSVRLWLLADAGFDGRDVDWTDVVPPVRRGGRLRAWWRVMRAALVERAKASGLYGQRWKVGLVIVVIKRRFGAGVWSWRLRLGCCEVLAKGLVHNLPCRFFVVCGCLVGMVGFERKASVVDWLSLPQSTLLALLQLVYQEVLQPLLVRRLWGRALLSS